MAIDVHADAVCRGGKGSWNTYTSEVATLDHKAGNDTVKAASLIAKSVLSSGKLTEVPRSFGNDVVVKLEGHPARLLAVYGDIEL